MTKRILRYVLQPGLTELQIPGPATPLRAEFKPGTDELSLWMLVSDGERESRRFSVVATGEEFEDGGDHVYVSTAILAHSPLGALVFHVFEVRP